MIEVSLTAMGSLILWLLLFLAGLIFYGVVLPLRMAKDCAASETLTPRARSRWILAILLLNFPGALAYGLWGTKKNFGRVLAASFAGVWLAVFFLMNSFF